MLPAFSRPLRPPPLPPSKPITPAMFPFFLLGLQGPAYLGQLGLAHTQPACGPWGDRAPSPTQALTPPGSVQRHKGPWPDYLAR